MYDLKVLEYDKVLKQIEPFCVTSYAKERLLALVPSGDTNEVDSKNSETAEAIKVLVKYANLPFSNYHNVLEALNLAEKGGILSALDILDVITLINTSLEVNKFFNNIFNADKDTYPKLSNYNNNLVNMSKLRNMLTLAVSNDGNILDQASKNLFQIRRRLSQTENKLRQTLNQIIASNITKLTEPLIAIRDNRMCLPVKIEYKNTFKGILHDISSSNNTCYIEPEECFVISSSIDNIKEEEKEEINKILAELSLLIKSNYDSLINNLDILTALDVIFAKAMYSKDYPRPLLAKDYSFSLNNVCHPLISKDTVVPISIKMTKNDAVIIITGPNTGGKTVTLKTVGLLSAMVQSGIFPNSKKESIYYVFKNIRADVGDEQSIEESLSTFSSHITKIKDILDNDLANSLVLLDEVGSGTDPKEGSALAISIINYIKSRGAKAIITTHYTDLKNYAYKTENVLNASVEFNINTLKPTYKVLLGVPGQSNALDIASNLGLNKSIIEEARQSLSHEVINEEVVNLEKRMEEIAKKEEELDSQEAEFKAQQQAFLAAKLKLEQDREKILLSAKKEADNLIEKAKEDAKDLITKLKEMQGSSFKEHVLADLKNKVNTLSSADISINPLKEKLNVGDFVKIIPYKQVGKILSINKDKYKVNFGQFTMDFKEKDLIKTLVKEEKTPRKTKLQGYNRVEGASMRLDLRGKRYEEVKDLLEDFIDKAVLANYEQVTIIHGYGQGVIRNRVQDLLKHNPNVKSFRYGGEGEGLNGATVVMLK